MCGISVAVCVKAMKQLVFYVSSPGSDSWVLAGAVLTYSTGGPALHRSGVSQAKQFQPSCKGRNQTKSGYSDTGENTKTPQPLRTFLWSLHSSTGNHSFAKLLFARHFSVALKPHLSVDSDR